MNYEDAVKRVKTAKPKDNYIIINFGYDTKIVFPYKEGITVLASLVNAERLKEPYNEPHRINPIDREEVKSQVMSWEEYECFKIAALMNITPAEVKEYALKTE